jgi:phosphohistidine phosphatase
MSIKLFEDTPYLPARKIILMRHGEAEGSPDKDRQLTLKGQSQSRSANNTLMSLNIYPDFVLCSGILRTQQTLAAMNIPDTTPRIFCNEDLYRATTYQDILNIIAENIPSGAICPLIIGHNPTIHDAVLHLAKESGGTKLKGIKTSYPSGTATVFDFTSDDWDLLHPSTCQLAYIISSL